MTRRNIAAAAKVLPTVVTALAATAAAAAIETVL